jgi:hypothetical protein
VGNRPQQPANNLAAPHCDLEVNGPKKLSKRNKYEGKCLEPSRSVCVPRDFREAAINRSVEELSLVFILAAGSSQTCSQLIHTHFIVVLASGLETRNRLRKRQEKNEFNFQLGQKNFLTEKLSARVCVKTETVRRKFRETQTAERSESPRPNRLGRLIVCASELTELAYARNFPPLRPEGQRSPSCRWRQPIPIRSGVFRCA